MNSKIINKKNIEWNKTIVIDNLFTTESNLKLYESQVNDVNLKLTDNEKNQQISFLVLRENILNKAMDILFENYEFDINNNDIELIFQNLNKNQYNESQIKELENQIIKNIKIDLVLDDIKENNHILVNDEEVENILLKYGIDKINRNSDNFIQTKKTLEKEKVINYIIKNFKIDTSKLQQNIYDSLSKIEKNN